MAGEILAHLYGTAGVVMSMDTRNRLLAVWRACHEYQDGGVSIDQVVQVFFRARRALRADLQVDDAEMPMTVGRIAKELKMTRKSA